MQFLTDILYACLMELYERGVIGFPPNDADNEMLVCDVEIETYCDAITPTCPSAVVNLSGEALMKDGCNEWAIWISGHRHDGTLHTYGLTGDCAYERCNHARELGFASWQELETYTMTGKPF